MMRFPLLLLLTCICAPVGAQASIRGVWEGEMRTSRWPQFITLTLAEGGAGTLETLGQRIPLEGVAVAGDSMRFRIGEGEGAVHVSGALREGRLAGTLIQGRDTLPFSLQPVPPARPASTREARWEQDIDALVHRFLAFDRSFTPEARGRFLASLEDTRARLGTLHDNEVIVRLASALALAGNAHTRLYLLRNATELRRLPVRVWWFADGLRVVRADPAHRHLLGCRVEGIGATTADQARERSRPRSPGAPRGPGT